MRAILELRAMAKRWPGMEAEIDDWIKRNVKEMGIEVSMDALSVRDKEHRNYNIEMAQQKLGADIAKHYNPSPDFWKTKTSPNFVCTIRAFVLENKL